MSLPGLFVVGTDTGVGKTAVASAIARTWTAMGKRVGVLKPVSTGCGIGPEYRPEDAIALVDAIGERWPMTCAAPISFPDPVAPPLAARMMGVSIESSEVLGAVASALEDWRGRGVEVMVIEGTGGLLCPLAEGVWTVADLAIWLDYPLLVVAHRALGTLNHTLLTVEAARSRGLRIAGVVLNGARPAVDPLAESSNAAELAPLLGDVPVLADWPYLESGDLGPVALEAAAWYDRAQMPRSPKTRPAGRSSE